MASISGWNEKNTGRITNLSEFFIEIISKNQDNE